MWSIARAAKCDGTLLTVRAPTTPGRVSGIRPGDGARGNDAKGGQDGPPSSLTYDFDRALSPVGRSDPQRDLGAASQAAESAQHLCLKWPSTPLLPLILGRSSEICRLRRDGGDSWGPKTPGRAGGGQRIEGARKRPMAATGIFPRMLATQQTEGVSREAVMPRTSPLSLAAGVSDIGKAQG